MRVNVHYYYELEVDGNRVLIKGPFSDTDEKMNANEFQSTLIYDGDKFFIESQYGESEYDPLCIDTAVIEAAKKLHRVCRKPEVGDAMTGGYSWIKLRGTLATTIHPDGHAVFFSDCEDHKPVTITGSRMMLIAMQCAGEIDVELEIDDALPYATVKKWWITESNDRPLIEQAVSAGSEKPGWSSAWGLI